MIHDLFKVTYTSYRYGDVESTYTVVFRHIKDAERYLRNIIKEIKEEDSIWNIIEQKDNYISYEDKGNKWSYEVSLNSYELKIVESINEGGKLIYE